MNERAMLLKRVQVCDFALNDTALYLDTHPDDKMALSYYEKYLKLRNDAVKEYTEKYGPIKRGDYTGGDSWKWVSDPWPWQMQEGE